MKGRASEGRRTFEVVQALVSRTSMGVLPPYGSTGQVVQDPRRLPADLEPLQSLLRELGGPVTVTVEATLQWAWLHDRLTQAGFPVCLAHPQQVS